MQCRASGCDGVIDEAQVKSIFTPCHGDMPLHPCGKCGLLHWEINGNQVIDGRNGMEVFLKDGQAFYADGQEADLDNDF